MHILVTGGTGFIGKALLAHLAKNQITLLTRSTEKAKEALAHLDIGHISYINALDELSDFNHIDAIVNLAGEPIIDKRWNSRQKKVICDSRWKITEQLVSQCHASSTPPHTFISGSAVGYYADQQDHPFDESLIVHHHDFAHHICAKWEEIAKHAESENTRVCVIRTGIVLGKCGGALSKMLFPYQLGLGGPIGHGQQYMPWIHLHDMVQAIIHLLNTSHAKGAFNLCAPHPVTNKEFSQTLAKTLHRPHLLFTPAWVIKLMLGESASLLLDSQRAKPKNLMDTGFEFQYSHLTPALESLLQSKS